MNILLYASSFLPTIGGIEITTQTLARNFVKLGHNCTVVTETPFNQAETEPYSIIRQPKLQERLKLAKEASIIHANGASVAWYPYAKFTNTSFVWTHNGYQVSCVDGLGWFEGKPAPINPIDSLKLYFQKKGFFYTTKEAIKLGFRRYVMYNVDRNIAGSEWVAKRQPLPNQVVGLTPYPISEMTQNIIKPKKYDFIFVGRLVSEKGVDNLIKAFHLLVSKGGYQDKTLAIVGYGTMKSYYESMVKELNLSKNITFLEPKLGDALNEILAECEVGIVPSVWEEPFGGITLQYLAAGKVVIVSEDGGHGECAGDAGLKFKNGDTEALFQCMLKLMENPDLITQLKEKAMAQLAKYDEVKLAQKYIEIYENVIAIRN
jgi:glycosyltransferase involved in cell wall biosynthesis